MKPEDIDQKLQRPDYSPPAPSPPPYQPAGDALGVQAIDQAAIEHAKKWGLWRGDGTIKCIKNGCDGDATLPTLECVEHRRRRTGQ